MGPENKMNSSACLREEAFAFLSPGYSGVDDIHVIVDVPPRSRGECIMRYSKFCQESPILIDWCSTSLQFSLSWLSAFKFSSLSSVSLLLTFCGATRFWLCNSTP
ncbi:hypothetical protein JG688_00018055 [Phytophthora aleatoria]|uniref:Uncharacterized protein n=1 Tax=Phytophthora aleatoria TaxID=2496075 RepID=A0A8J5IRY1_9STRA|nr:hypothetical protein JG688_00018055 [Phytophthora aleatoria]